MRKTDFGVILALLVVASLGAGYLAGNSNRQTGTITSTSTSVSTSTLTSERTVTSTATSTSTETALFVPGGAATAIGSNGSTGIDLVLAVNATTLKVGQRLNVEVALFNPLPSANSLTPSLDWPLGSPGTSNFTGGVPIIFGNVCGYDVGPFVRAAVLQGDYTPQELQSATNSDLLWQCSGGPDSEITTFSPESSIANVTNEGPGSNVTLPPRAMSISFNTDGYWDLQNFSTQNDNYIISYTGSDPPVATPFVSGVYTVVVSDEWGNEAILHFAVNG